MTPNEELTAQFLALIKDIDRARDKFMAHKVPPAAHEAAIEANPKEEPK